VTDYNVGENTIHATGPIIASSESLTHAMIYEYADDIHAVIHVHHMELWKRLLNSRPATAENIEYGTPEMANEIGRLFNEKELSRHRIFAMAGHSGGIVCFGKSLHEAGKLLLDQIKFD
jgi:ribulose-5-phosphate 4-epimerase/fuculose-1-phosphate aldolase